MDIQILSRSSLHEIRNDLLTEWASTGDGWEQIEWLNYMLGLPKGDILIRDGSGPLVCMHNLTGRRRLQMRIYYPFLEDSSLDSGGG